MRLSEGLKHTEGCCQLALGEQVPAPGWGVCEQTRHKICPAVVIGVCSMTTMSLPSWREQRPPPGAWEMFWDLTPESVTCRVSA